MADHAASGLLRNIGGISGNAALGDGRPLAKNTSIVGEEVDCAKILHLHE